MDSPKTSLLVIPAQAGIQWLQFPDFALEQMLVDSRDNRPQSHWIPACAGMTMETDAFFRFPEGCSP
jgi:hypothetical protein